jgi:two-component system OmpR family response regulator
MPAPTITCQALPHGRSAGAAAGAAAPRRRHATANHLRPGAARSSAGRVTVDGSAVRLTSHEYRLLAYLMHHKGKVVSRTELVEHLYDQDFDRDSNTIEVFVGRLTQEDLGVDPRRA